METNAIQIEKYEHALRCAEYLGFREQVRWYREKIIELKRKEVALLEVSKALADFLFTAAILRASGVPFSIYKGQIYVR